ncbi:hypothetical protein DM860_012576 [Cuscuta australis]|uniref:Uncharacterized protein n=1 Tax=Cuscuta australis TaxID=267555 RepID=A0A328DCC6_9ASTE|nr:hypothetical protein DM860_012576 [Cuscuta australis]
MLHPVIIFSPEPSKFAKSEGLAEEEKAATPLIALSVPPDGAPPAYAANETTKTKVVTNAEEKQNDSIEIPALNSRVANVQKGCPRKFKRLTISSHLTPTDMETVNGSKGKTVANSSMALEIATPSHSTNEKPKSDIAYEASATSNSNETEANDNLSIQTVLRVSANEEITTNGPLPTILLQLSK